MDVSNLTKKAFSLGKKYSALKESVTKLNAQQILFYTKNADNLNLTSDAVGHWKTQRFAEELKEINAMAKSEYNDPNFVSDAEEKLKSFETKLLDKKINFHMLLIEYGCCEHNLTIKKNV